MTINQLSVFLDNRPGRLSKLTSILKEHDINIRALYVADTTDYGILRMVVDDTDKAVKILNDNDFTVSKTKVLAVAIADKPGGLYKVAKVFADNDISIEYLYAFVTNANANEAVVVIRTQDADTAAEILKPLGVRLVKENEI